MSKAICKQGCSTSYFQKDTFNGVPISIWDHLKSVALLIKNIHLVIGIIDEKFGVIRSI
jgi:hypothetical protein